MKTTTRVFSLLLCLAMLVGVFAMSAFAAGETVVVSDNFNGDLDGWTFTREGDKAFVAGADNKVMQLVNVEATATDEGNGLRTDNPRSSMRYSRTDIAVGNRESVLTLDLRITGDVRVSVHLYGQLEGAASKFTCPVYFKADGVYTSANSGYGTDETKKADFPAGFDASKWHTYELTYPKTLGDGNYISIKVDGVEVSWLNGEKWTVGGCDPTPKLELGVWQHAGVAEFDNVKYEAINADGTKEVIFQDNMDDFSANWSNKASQNAPGTAQNSVPRATEYLTAQFPSASSGNQWYADSPAYTAIPVDQEYNVTFKARLNGGEVGFLSASAITDSKGNQGKAIRRLYISLRNSAEAGYPAGLYEEKGASLLVDLAGLDMAQWHTYSFKVTPVSGKATLYVDGVEKGTFDLEAQGYTATNAALTKAQFMMLNIDMGQGKTSGLEGSADIDDFKISYGTAAGGEGGQGGQGGGNAQTGDASIIALAAMMLPVSGFGVGALCFSRKKEN